jgi:hypothetical protein
MENSRTKFDSISDVEKTRIEFKWREYDTHINLYKFYLDLALKVNGFFYLILGGVLTIYFSKDSERRDIAVILFLLLPIAMSAVLGVIFIHGANLWKKITERINRIKTELSLYAGVEKAPDVRLLYQLLRVFAIFFFIVFIALIVLMAHLLSKS